MKSTKLLFTSLLLSLTIFFSNCSKDNNLISTTTETLTRSNWGVDYYFNTQDMTSNYGNYRFLFSGTGLLVAQKDNETVMGSWSSSADGAGNEIFTLTFNTTDVNFIQLSQQWKVISKTPATIEFEEAGHGNAPEVFRIKKQ